MALDDVHSILLNRVLVRLYEDVATINSQIHQVNADVGHLVHTRQITREDAQFIISTVPLATDPSATTMDHAQGTLETLSDSPPSQPVFKPTPMKAYASNTSVTAMMQSHKEGRRPVPKPPVVNTFQARVLWDYNVNNEHPDDLAMYHGDLITVDAVSAEKNADWWEGTIRGQSGLFPSTYVERITHALPPSPPAPAIVQASRPSSEVSAPTYTPYRSTHAAMNPADGGPNALGLQAPQGDEQKKGKYDHLKRTMANSAASGAGFGAGAAIGGGLVRAIF